MGSKAPGDEFILTVLIQVLKLNKFCSRVGGGKR